MFTIFCNITDYAKKGMTLACLGSTEMIPNKTVNII